MPFNLFQWKPQISTHLVTEVSVFIIPFLIADTNIFQWNVTEWILNLYETQATLEVQWVTYLLGIYPL